MRESSRYSMNRLTLVTALLALAMFISAGTYVASRQSATWDETAHIGAGVGYLRGDLRLNPEHPPLMKVLAALGLPERTPAIEIPQGDRNEVQWAFGARFLHGADQAPLALLLRARLPIILLSALLLPLVAAWAWLLGGHVAARFAMLLLATCPLWFAHATLVTTDAGATLFFFGAAYFAARIERANSVKAIELLGLAACMCLGVMTKYSLLAAVGLLPLSLWFAAESKEQYQNAVKGIAACAAGALLGVTTAWGLPIDPMRYVRGVQEIGANHQTIPAYAFGHVFSGRFLGYFVAALAVKVCAPILALLALAPALPSRTRAPTEDNAPSLPYALVIPPLGYLALMSVAAPALGVRYVLPVLPFMIVIAGVSAARLWHHARLRWLLLPLSAAQVLGLASALRATPIAYFNGLGCFTGEATPCLDDSNVDWGQALPALRDYRDAHFPGAPIRVIYFGSSPPAAYVPGAIVAGDHELYRPQASVYAISQHLRARVSEQAWVRRLPPRDVIGGAYAIYDLRGATRLDLER